MALRVTATSIVDAVATDLRSRLLVGELTPDVHLTENEIATSYQVARPTAKAAIEKLVAEGLLVRGVHKTAHVTTKGVAKITIDPRFRYLPAILLSALKG